MAAAVPLASTLFTDPAFWVDHAPDHAALLTVVGGGAVTTGPQTMTALLNMTRRSPVALAFVLAGDEDHIHVG